LRRFNRQFVKVWKSRKDLVDAWKQENGAGIVGKLIAALKDRTELTTEIRELRADLSRLERTYVRLLELREYCVGQGIAGNIGFLRSTKTFFARLERDRRTIELRRSLVRWFAHQYAMRNDGSVPLGAFDDAGE
jgi:hypothetical protein